MGKNQEYTLLDADEQEKGIDWNSSSEIVPTNTKGFIAYLSILLISLSTNVLLLLHHFPPKYSRDLGRTIYSENTFDTHVPYHSFTQFWDPDVNQSVSDEAWDAIETNPMAVALDNDYAKDVELPASIQFPWDTERSIYYVKGFHDLHCLKLIRRAIVTREYGDHGTPLKHLFHCLDGLRQDVMCMADDTPMPVVSPHHIGDGQVRKCRNWDKLQAWATRPDQDACLEFDDYREVSNSLELFASCPADSPYRSIAEEYFERHGHKDAYKGEDEVDVLAEKGHTLKLNNV